MSPWEKILERPPSGGHFVQLYEADEAALTRNVASYIWQGLRRGEGVLIIATPEHRDCFTRHLTGFGANVSQALNTEQLIMLDARETLGQFLIAGQPDWERFETAIRRAMRRVQPAGAVEQLRAYGEMVGVLWNARQFAAAIRLEQLWNRLLAQSAFSLYCAYAVDVFGREFELASLEDVLCTHTHLVPAQPDGSLETAIKRAMDEILGPKADKLRILIKANYNPSWALMPNAENIVFWLRKNLPHCADQILDLARRNYHLLLQPGIPSTAE
jgi:KaiC/GvpD/RAD55 family RecA-like ATPase